MRDGLGQLDKTQKLIEELARVQLELKLVNPHPGALTRNQPLTPRIPNSGTRNPGPETRIPKLETSKLIEELARVQLELKLVNPHPGALTRNQPLTPRNPNSGTRNPKSETRGPKPESRNLKPRN